MLAVTIDETKLRQLVDVFLAENAKLNLSAFRTAEQCWKGNVLDSLAFLQTYDLLQELKNIKRLADIGTGGGFPLLPLALSLPSVHCIGIDSTQKKIDALRRILSTMKMHNIELRSERLEDIGHDTKLRGTLDLVTGRAVASLPVLLEYAIPLLRIGGLCAFWKSDKIADELASSANAQKLLGASLLRTYEYDLGEGYGKRTILFFRKDSVTKDEYPRKTGIPKLRPL